MPACGARKLQVGQVPLQSPFRHSADDFQRRSVIPSIAALGAADATETRLQGAGERRLQRGGAQPVGWQQQPLLLPLPVKARNAVVIAREAIADECAACADSRADILSRRRTPVPIASRRSAARPAPCPGASQDLSAEPVPSDVYLELRPLKDEE
eukprot:scaffold218582_cov31-Tisochrysis_lutea.AAC.4